MFHFLSRALGFHNRFVCFINKNFCFQNKFNEHGMHYVFNHVDITIKYHEGKNEDWDGARLMSAKVTPKR